MKEEDEKTLKKSLEDSYVIRDDFFSFQIQTKVQLLLSQLQFSQSLGGISLALLAIGAGTQTIELSLWSLLSIGFAFVLLIYSSSLYREIIDLQVRDLDEADILLRKTQDKIETKVIESLQKNNFSIYLTYLGEEIKNRTKTQPHSLQLGEIVVLLFLNTLGFGLLSILNPEINCFFRLAVVALVLLVTYLLSFKNWSYPLTKMLSKPL